MGQYAYDAAGNETSLTNAAGTETLATYDPWHHLQSLGMDTFVGGHYLGNVRGFKENARYGYDALGRQVFAADDIEDSSPDHARRRLESLRLVRFFSADGQVLEEDKLNDDGSRSLKARYVWNPAAPDRLVLRDYDVDGNPANGPEQRLYPLQDAAGKVAALVDRGGVVRERYQYDPFGLPTALKADGSLDSDPINLGADPVHWEYLDGGRRYDWVLSTYQRPGGGAAYSPVQARALQPGPLAFARGGNAYALDGYAYTAGQLQRGGESWWGTAWDAFWQPSRWGAASEVTQPRWVQWTSRGLMAAGTVMTFGWGAAAWMVGSGVGGGLIGAGVAAYGGGDVADGAGLGTDIGMLAGDIAGIGIAWLNKSFSVAATGGVLSEKIDDALLEAVRLGKLDGKLLVQGLRGVTSRSSLIADAIEDYSLGVKWYDTLEALRSEYAGTKAGVKAFHSNGVLHIVRDTNAFENAVHEGVHGLAWLQNESWAAEKYKDLIDLPFRSNFWEEVLANTVEQEFKKAAYSAEPWTRFTTLKHVRDSHPENLDTIDPQSIEYLRRYSLWT